jgi:CheY-like chemotaxis protein
VAGSMQGRPLAVLIVEDDDDNREVMGEVLTDEGYAVSYARDGAEALSQLRSARPDIILLDLNMPTMSGVEFRAAQVRDPALALIPTVVLSAVDPLRELAGELTPQATVPKPLKLAELLSIVRRYAQAT